MQAAREIGRKTKDERRRSAAQTFVFRLSSNQHFLPSRKRSAESCEGAFGPARVNFAGALAANDPARLTAAAEELTGIGAHLLAAEAAAAAATAWRRAGEQRRATAATHAARASAARCPGVRTPLLAGIEVSWALTEREREIVLLAADNLRSKEIGETLHLSARTVDNHLQRAYAKLGVTNRRELADALNLSS